MELKDEAWGEGEFIFQVQISNYGCTIVSCQVPDRNGTLEDVVLGFKGRVTNRVDKGKFTLNNQEYYIQKNETSIHAEHGGKKGFSAVKWELIRSEKNDNNLLLQFQYKSPNGEEGFPGNTVTNFTYTLNNNNELNMIYEATTDQDTVLNLTHHAYFNLKGINNTSNDKEKDFSIMNHIVTINANEYIDVDSELIPTGIIKSVVNTPMDFREPKKINTNIPSDYDAIVIGEQGYDSSWLGNDYLSNNKEEKKEYLIASAYEETSGRLLEVTTTYPTVQFYTGNCLDGVIGKNGLSYQKQLGFCFETQHYTNAPNIPSFPSILLKPEDRYYETSTYKFSVRS